MTSRDFTMAVLRITMLIAAPCAMSGCVSNYGNFPTNVAITPQSESNTAWRDDVAGVFSRRIAGHRATGGRRRRCL
jgi:hypothetical protein